MTRARMDGLYLMLLGGVVFLLVGVVLINSDTVPAMDFRTAHFSGQCLLQRGCDPYNERDIERLYLQSKVDHPPATERERTVIIRNIYLPPAFAFTVPLALLPFHLGLVIWLILIAASFLLASFLMWDVGARRAPIIAAGLICFCLANSGSLLHFANPAGFVVPLCVLASWCFIEERFVLIGILSLALGLAFKPHDVAFVWLFFFLAGGTLRHRALQTLAGFAVFGVPATLWVRHISPNFLQEISSNLKVFTVKGGMNDPSGGHGTELLTNLQAITSFFWENAHIYDLVSYLICAPLLIIWAFVTWRSRPSRGTTWFGLAAIAALSMLPVYHRQYDAKLIILAIPALAILWARRDKLAWIGLVVTTAAFVLNGDIPWAFFITAVGKLHLSAATSYGRLLTAVWDFPVPLSLLLMGTFYLWIYARSSLTADAAKNQSIAREQAQISPALSS